MSKAAAFWFGLFGAALPEVVRYMRLVASTKIDPPPSGWIAYAIISLLYLGAAGILSVAWRPDNEYKAIWVGASFPAIVQTLIATAPVHNP